LIQFNEYKRKNFKNDIFGAVITNLDKDYQKG
jgi:hypothetical protein